MLDILGLLFAVAVFLAGGLLVIVAGAICIWAIIGVLDGGSDD